MTSPLPGDFGLVRTLGFVPAAIRLATRSPVNHAFVYVGDGQIVEAQPHGARVSELAGTYSRVRWSSFDLTDTQRQVIVSAARSMVGTPYGFADIAALALSAFGIDMGWAEKRLAQDHRLICSQLVAVAYAAAGVDLSRGLSVAAVTPGMLLVEVDGL